MERRITSRNDLDLVMNLFSQIKDVSDRTAEVLKSLPNIPGDNGSVAGIIAPDESDESLIMHFLILARQMAELEAEIRGIIRSKKHLDAKIRKDSLTAYRAFMQTTLGDVLYQAGKLCDELSLGFMETWRMGTSRNKEKGAEFSRKYPGRVWY